MRDQGILLMRRFRVVLALFRPLDGRAKISTAAHVIRHMLLMVVMVPLWVLSQPCQQLAGLIMWMVGGVPYRLASGWRAHR